MEDFMAGLNGAGLKEFRDFQASDYPMVSIKIEFLPEAMMVFRNLWHSRGN